jgi:hypothetical protein
MRLALRARLNARRSFALTLDSSRTVQLNHPIAMTNTSTNDTTRSIP